jgi:tRNA(fMet)-specific endonuclease VapC
MNRYLLDTNHLSAYLDRRPDIERRIDAALKSGERFGICLPVLCEYRTGTRAGRRFKRNLGRLQAALAVLRLWPAGDETAVEYADLFHELRVAGRTPSQFDLLIAAIARQHRVTLLTADGDFAPINRLNIENWLQ